MCCSVLVGCCGRCCESGSVSGSVLQCVGRGSGSVIASLGVCLGVCCIVLVAGLEVCLGMCCSVLVVCVSRVC